MIVRVEDATGNVVHDCMDAGCAVSWDGVDMATGLPVAGAPLPKALPAHDVVELLDDPAEAAAVRLHERSV